MPRNGGLRPCTDAVRPCFRPCVGVVVSASFQRFRDGTPLSAAMLAVVRPSLMASHGHMACGWLGFGGFPTLNLWIAQVMGDKFCDGIVNKTSDSAKTAQSSAPSTRRVLSYPMVYHARARE